MNIGIRQTTQEINSQIVEDYYEVPLSVAALVDKYGRHESTINKLIARYKEVYRAENEGLDRVRRGKPHDPRKTGDRKSISLRHFLVGLAVQRYMDENSLTPTSFGHMISRSPSKVGNITAGVYPLTLEEVDRIAEVLGLSFDVLLNSPQEKVRNVA